MTLETKAAETVEPGLSALLEAAAEAGELVEVHAIIARHLGPGAAVAAQRAWTDRIAKQLSDTTQDAPAERSGSPAAPSETALHLVRRLPDPSKGGQAGQVVR